MHKYFALTHALLKNVSLFSDGKSNKIKIDGFIWTYRSLFSSYLVFILYNV